jgi:hypothetical protein
VLRYFLIATALVAAVLLVVVNLPHATRVAGESTYSSGRGTPGPAQRDPRTATTAPTTGEAPWALDVLPECFHELERASGTPAFARAKLPPAGRALPAGTVLRVADCTLAIGDRRAVVTRGADRLIVPPVARFYRDGPRRIVLDRADGRREDVRVFALRGP